MAFSKAKHKRQSLGRIDMLRTITVGSCVSVQGTFVGTLPGGKISVRVGKTVYSGTPISAP